MEAYMNKTPQVQGSPEWLEWRKNVISSTDASIILGVNPFKSALELLDQKMGFRPFDEENDAMRRGKALEEEAREAFEALTGYIVFPQVKVGKPEWMVASFDGLSLEEDIAVEIKCLGKKNAEKIHKTKKIPDYYMAQLQHQMVVADLTEMYFFSYHPDDNLSELLVIKHDMNFINKMIYKETRFYKIMMECKKEKQEFDELYDGYKSELARELYGDQDIDEVGNEADSIL